MFDQLANLSSNYHLGENPAIDDFIIQIEKAFNPSEYSSFEINQGELEKTLNIGNKPLIYVLLPAPMQAQNITPIMMNCIRLHLLSKQQI